MDAPDIVTRALIRSEPTENVEEPRQRGLAHTCLETGCDRVAVRSDGYCAKHSNYRVTTVDLKRRAREMIERHALGYARLHFQAARVAALKGDAEPAERGLLLGRAIDPIQKESGGSGVVVNVGVVLPGLREA